MKSTHAILKNATGPFRRGKMEFNRFNPNKLTYVSPNNWWKRTLKPKGTHSSPQSTNYPLLSHSTPLVEKQLRLLERERERDEL